MHASRDYDANVFMLIINSFKPFPSATSFCLCGLSLGCDEMSNLDN